MKAQTIIKAAPASQTAGSRTLPARRATAQAVVRPTGNRYLRDCSQLCCVARAQSQTARSHKTLPVCDRSRLGLSPPSAVSTSAPPSIDREETAAPSHYAFLGQLNSLPEAWGWLAHEHGDRIATIEPHRDTPALNYRQVAELIHLFGSGLHALGVQRGDRVALFAEDSSRWLLADQGIQLVGGIDAVRGILSILLDELKYIMEHTGASAVVAQDAATVERLAPVLPEHVKLVIVQWGPAPTGPLPTPHPVKVVTFEEVIQLGSGATASFTPPRLERSDLATLVFTSGTSGQPKGAMLSHGNLLHQVQQLEFLRMHPGDKTVAYLPPWHIYGRTVEYAGFMRAVTQVYSTVRLLQRDLYEHQPDVLYSVPLMLDALHSKAMTFMNKLHEDRRATCKALLSACERYVRAKRVLGGTDLRHAHKPPTFEERATAEALIEALEPLREAAEASFLPALRKELGFSRGFATAGGGSLANHLDDFYEAVGIPILGFYGLTETSPLLTTRRFECNVRGTIGVAFPDTDIRIAHPTTYEWLPDGEKGLIMAKGPGIMRGYYNKPDKTTEAFSKGYETGWFDTGDLGWKVPHSDHHGMGGNVVITGRKKDTIVLANGENVEPSPLEDLLQRSPFISQVVLVGQNQRALGALIVPDWEALAEAGALTARAHGDKALANAELFETIMQEVNHLMAQRQPHERVRTFALLEEPFSVEDGTLTRSLKLRRHVIFEKYARVIEEVERQLH